MGSNRVARITPIWLMSVGAMREAGVRVQAHCRKCKIALRVNLDTLCTLKGRSYCLIGVASCCKVVGCDGQMIFAASPGVDTPFLPLLNNNWTGVGPVGERPDERPLPHPKRVA